jgi:hypothetical protein
MIKKFTKDLTFYLSEHFLELIVFSVLLLVIRNTLTLLLLTTSINGPLITPISIFAFLVSFFQLFSIFTFKKYAWFISALQILVILISSLSTFGFIWEQILKPLIWEKETYEYVMSSCLVLSELYKTYWLYKNLK